MQKLLLDGTWKGFDENLEDEGLTFVGIFILGILTSVTPCSLALLIAMISYVGSMQKDSEKKSKKYSLQGLWIGIIFTLGMSLVFFVFGMIISSVGVFIEASTVFFLIAGIILIILGINIFKPFSELFKKKSEKGTGLSFIEKGQGIFFKLSKKSIYLGAFFLGILFSIGWAPCALSLDDASLYSHAHTENFYCYGWTIVVCLWFRSWCTNYTSLCCYK